MRSLTTLAVGLLTAITLLLVLAVGAVAENGGPGSVRARNSLAAVVAMVAPARALDNSTRASKHEDGKNDNNGHCKGKHLGNHRRATAGHEHKPCGDSD